MKKSLLISLIILSGILFTACGKKSQEVVDDKPTDIVVEFNKCEKAVQKYLDGADKQGVGEEVKKGDNITVDYIGRLEDGTVFETTIRSIAEACDIYDENLDYTHGYEFNVGVNQMIKGFDEGVIGMKVGQTKTVQFGPEEGYGEYDEKLVLTVPVSDFGDVSQFSEGDIVYVGMGYPTKIIKITDKEITLDMNSELAGKNLIFDITLKSIN